MEAGAGFVDILPRFDTFATSLTAGITSSLAKVEASTTGTSRLTKIAQLGFVALGAAAVAAIGKGIQATQQWAGDVRTLQKVTGQTAESASSLATVAHEFGISIDQLNVGFGIFEKNIVNGSANLQKYGLETRDATGAVLPFDTVLGAAADKFVSFGKGAQGTAFAMNVFGRSGRNLIPILSLGADGIARMEAQARKLGTVLSQQDVDASRALSIAQRQLSQSFLGLEVSIGTKFVPSLTVLVHALTDVVELIDRIPSPVIAGTLAFTGLTAVVASAFKVAGFFTNTWTKLLETTRLKAAADAESAASGTAAAGAMTLQTEAVTLLTGAVDRLAESLGVALPAATGRADAALVGFGATESGLLVPTKALNAPVPEGSFLASLGSFASQAVLPLAAVAGAFFLIRRGIQDAHKEFQAGVAKDLASIKTGGFTALLRLQAQARSPVPLGQIPPTPIQGAFAGNVNPFSKNIGIDQKEASAALAQYRENLKTTTTSTKGLTASIADEVAGLQTAKDPISEAGAAVGQLSEINLRAQSSLQSFSRFSGQATDAILSSLQSVIDKAGSTPTQVVAAYQTAIQGLIAANKQWHDSLVSAFGGASDALSSFFGQAHVNFDKLNTALDTQRASLSRWQGDFHTILRSGGDAAKQFLSDMSTQGLKSIRILDAVAAEPAKQRDAFLKNYNQVNKATSSLATDIQTALDHSFKHILDVFKEIANQIAIAAGNVPPFTLRADDKATPVIDTVDRKANALAHRAVKLDILVQDSASAALDRIHQKLVSIAGLAKINILISGNLERGGIIGSERGSILPAAAAGLITQPTIYRGVQTGEHSNVEAIVPLETPLGISLLARAQFQALRQLTATLRVQPQQMTWQGPVPDKHDGHTHYDTEDLSKMIGAEVAVAVAKALRGAKVEMDGRELGRLVTRQTSRELALRDR